MDLRLGEKLKEYRLKKGLSLSELAKRSGIAKSYISSIENKKQFNPSIECLIKVCSVLETPIDALIWGNEHTNVVLIDKDWADLVHKAINAGIDRDQFNKFIDLYKWQNKKSSKPKFVLITNRRKIKRARLLK